MVNIGITIKIPGSKAFSAIMLVEYNQTQPKYIVLKINMTSMAKIKIGILSKVAFLLKNYSKTYWYIQPVKKPPW